MCCRPSGVFLSLTVDTQSCTPRDTPPLAGAGARLADSAKAASVAGPVATASTGTAAYITAGIVAGASGAAVAATCTAAVAATLAVTFSSKAAAAAAAAAPTPTVRCAPASSTATPNPIVSGVAIFLVTRAIATGTANAAAYDALFYTSIFYALPFTSAATSVASAAPIGGLDAIAIADDPAANAAAPIAAVAAGGEPCGCCSHFERADARLRSDAGADADAANASNGCISDECF